MGGELYLSDDHVPRVSDYVCARIIFNLVKGKLRIKVQAADISTAPRLGATVSNYQ